MTIRQNTHNTNDLIYTEKVSSAKTDALFLGLMILFLLLLIWRLNTIGMDILTVIFSCFFLFFLFYSVNYKTLIIHLTSKSLKLKFGIFTWIVPMDNVDESHIDEIPLLIKMGGAGIHFMVVHKRYRASFNFLEHPRVLIALKRKVGLIQDISFSTQQPDEFFRLIQEAISENRVAQNSNIAGS